MSKSEFKLDLSRQIRVSGMNQVRQEEINNSRVLVIGAGGLATTALSYLSLSGVGNLTIVDFDTIENSNLHRQTLFTPKDIGRNKAEVAKEYLMQRAPDIKINAISHELDISELLSLVKSHDVMLDCTDDLAFSYMLNDVAILEKKPVVFANATGMTGQIFTMIPSNEPYSCFRCVWPENLETLGSCDALGVMGPVPGVMGSLQALEALKILSGFCDVQSSTLYHVDFSCFNVQPIRIPVNHAQYNHNLSESDVLRKYEPIPIFDEVLSQACDKGFDVIDVRDSQEVIDTPCPFTTEHIYLESLLNTPSEFIEPDKTYVVICNTGKRSQAATKQLRSLGHTNVFAYKKSWIDS